MKTILSSFKQFIKQISKDSVLLIISFSPILTGAIFKFGIPYAEKFLTQYFNKVAIISPYYLLIDIFLAVITPYMFCLSSAMVILEEIDTGLTSYLSVTPIGKSGYLISRLLFPAGLSAMFSIIMILLFSLTNMSLPTNILLSVLTSCIGAIMPLLIVSFSSNKVEGMALAKLGGLFLLGIPIPFFITETEQYFGALLPSFWVAKYMLDFNIWSLLGATISVLLWSVSLYSKFDNKII